MPDKNCQVIEEVERQWCDALVGRDMERLRELVHPDFVLIGTRSSGPFQMQRDEWLDAIERRDVDSIELEIRDATILDTVRRIHETLHGEGVVRLSTAIKLGTRTDKPPTLSGKRL